MDQEHSIHSQCMGTDLPEGSSKKRKGRSATQCDRLTNMPASERVNVEFNIRGQPIGKGKHDLASYGSMVARSLVSINVKKWHKVDVGTRDSIWKAIKVNVFK